MALADGVEGARLTAQTITWTDESGTAVDLTGATLTGNVINISTGVSAAIDGTLTITDAANGVFTWDYGSTDVGTAGNFLVQFVATVGGQSEKTIPQAWRVHDAL